MNCQETNQVLDGYIDGELDLVKSLEVEQHLEQCPACAQKEKTLATVRATIQAAGLRFEPPAGLRLRIQSSLRDAVRSEPASRRWRLPRLALAASLLLAVLVGWGARDFLASRSAAPALTEELLASHIRSQMFSGHQVDVQSSDQHTVKPWFQGKLDFSPPVVDLRGDGFPLVGGRVDYVGHRPVAALVYQCRQHVINLFVWPTEKKAAGTASSLTRQGFHLVSRQIEGMTYWAVSDLNENDLEHFMELIGGKIMP